MADASEHAAVVFSGIIPGRRDLLDKALRHLTPAHFPEKLQANLFTMLQRYAEVTGKVVTASALGDMLRKKDTGQAQLYLEAYELYEATTVADSDVVWSIQELRDLAAERATAEVITEGMNVLRQGKLLKGGDELRGHEDARAFILEEFSALERDMTMQEAPEGDMREERVDLLSDYAERKKARLEGTSQGILFGIQELDARTGGMQPGELILAVGYSSDGKTTLCTQVAWSAAVEQGKNVVFLTTETLRSQVRRKLLARHSCLPQFGLPEGLNTRDLKAGTLSDDEESKLTEVIDDMAKNENYGRLYVAQVPRGSTILSIEQRLYRIQRKFDIDLVVFDYLALSTTGRRRTSIREELTELLKEAKSIAATFNDGQGVAFMSPWQVNRSQREEAEKSGMYTTKALAETSEATNSADVIISLLAPTDNTARVADVKMQVMKNRDGETANDLAVRVDYATAAFTSRSSLAFERRETGVSFGSEGFGLETLLD